MKFLKSFSVVMSDVWDFNRELRTQVEPYGKVEIISLTDQTILVTYDTGINEIFNLQNALKWSYEELKTKFTLGG